MKKIALISAILENPGEEQRRFNDIVSSFKGIVKGRMGLPFDDEQIAVIALTVAADEDTINNLTEKLNEIEGVSVETLISKRTVVL